MHFILKVWVGWEPDGAAALRRLQRGECGIHGAEGKAGGTAASRVSYKVLKSGKQSPNRPGVDSPPQSYFNRSIRRKKLPEQTARRPLGNIDAGNRRSFPRSGAALRRTARKVSASGDNNR